MIGPEWALGGDPQGVVLARLIGHVVKVPEDDQSGVIRASSACWRRGWSQPVIRAAGSGGCSRMNGWK